MEIVVEKIHGDGAYPEKQTVSFFIVVSGSEDRNDVFKFVKDCQITLYNMMPSGPKVLSDNEGKYPPSINFKEYYTVPSRIYLNELKKLEKSVKIHWDQALNGQKEET